MRKVFPWYCFFFLCISIFCTTATFALPFNGFSSALKADTLIRDTITKPFESELTQDTIRQSLTPGDSLLPERMSRASLVPKKEEAPKDTMPASAVPWYTEEQLQTPFKLNPNYVDTTLTGFQMYDFASRESYFYAQKGNIGHRHRQLVYDPDMTTGLIINDHKYYGGYLLRHQDLKFYRPKHVFTELYYVMGSEREQSFYAQHNQKLHETFHIGFQYQVVNSTGFFSREGARNSGFSFTGDYLSTDKRYQALASVVINRIRNHESGGLEDYTLYEEDQDNNIVILDKAESRLRDISVNLRHFYQTGFYTAAADTAKESRFINLGRINHDFSYKRTAFVYTDNQPLYPHYDFPRMDSTITYDSTTVHRIVNLISWSNFPLTSGRGTFPFNFKLYLKHSINVVEQPVFKPSFENQTRREEKQNYSTRNSFNELVQGIELQSDQRRLFSFGGYANATLGGYHDEDIHSGAFLHLGKPDRNYNIELMLRYSLTEAPYFYNHFAANNIIWENDFDKMQIINLRAKMESPFLTLEGNYYLLDKMVYLGTDALPVQNRAELGFFSLGAYSNLRLGWFGFRNHIVAQQATSENFKRYPDIISYHSVFLNFGLSDNALINQIGFDFHYNTGYYAMAYLPLVRDFYVQNNHAMNDKFLLDVFWNGKIKNARLFVKYQNILGLLPDIRPHYDIPFYPIPQTMFKFGVSWMFFN